MGENRKALLPGITTIFDKCLDRRDEEMLERTQIIGKRVRCDTPVVRLQRQSPL
jgi:hypothetical protein